MQVTDREKFYALVADVYAFYRVDCTPFALGVWWEACKPYDAPAVKDAMNRHAVNPDNGQFLPKPADVVKLIGGGTQDAALVAWSKVERALRLVGTYRTVVFDDPIIHAVVNDMGGWIAVGRVQIDELPFRAKEFENRYRGFRIRGRLENYPGKLVGIIDATNQQNGYQEETPKLIGDPARCALVLKGGGDGSGLQIASDFVAQRFIENHV